MKRQRKIINKSSPLSLLTARGSDLIACAHVNLTMNNIIVTITAPNGDVLAKKTAGSCDFASTQRSTKYAAEATGLAAGLRLKELIKQDGSVRIRSLIIYTRGIAKLRDAVIRGLASAGFNIEGIFDVTPIPHNGCRPPKRRRI